MLPLHYLLLSAVTQLYDRHFLEIKKKNDKNCLHFFLKRTGGMATRGTSPITILMVKCFSAYCRISTKLVNKLTLTCQNINIFKMQNGRREAFFCKMGKVNSEIYLTLPDFVFVFPETIQHCFHKNKNKKFFIYLFWVLFFWPLWCFHMCNIVTSGKSKSEWHDSTCKIILQTFTRWKLLLFWVISCYSLFFHSRHSTFIYTG